MEQSRAINALAPYVALAKSANSPRAAADLITQATSAPNTYIFAELLQQPNIQSLSGHEQYGVYHTFLQCFAWGTWETYQSTPGLPQLSDAQALKLRLLSLLTIASQKLPLGSSSQHNLSYASLSKALDLTSSIDLEHFATTAIYNGLITGSLNPEAQTVVITSVAPLRDLAPGSVQSMVAELAAWSGRCDTVLAELEAEIKKVRSDAERRAKRDARTEKQIKVAMEASEKAGGGSGGAQGGSRGGHNTRGGNKREPADDDDDDDAMDVDGGGNVMGGRKKPAGGGSGTGGLLSKFTGGGRR